MSYLDKSMMVTAGAAGPVSLTSVADIQYFPMLQNQVLQRAAVMVSTAVVSTGAVVINVIARPIHGSTVGQVVLGTLSVPAATAAGVTVYKDFSDALTVIQGGYELVYAVLTAAAGGGAAGAVLPMALLDGDPEVPLNQASLLASA